jgi:hypothetical protein
MVSCCKFGASAGYCPATQKRQAGRPPYPTGETPVPLEIQALSHAKVSIRGEILRDGFLRTPLSGSGCNFRRFQRVQDRV